MSHRSPVVARAGLKSGVVIDTGRGRIYRLPPEEAQMSCYSCHSETVGTGTFGGAGHCQLCGAPLSESTPMSGLERFIERLRRFGLGDVHQPIFRELRRKPRGS